MADLNIAEGFYRSCRCDEEKVYDNIELAIDLYLGKTGGKGEASANYEKALGMLTVGYLRYLQSSFRRDSMTAEEKLLVNFGVMDPRLINNAGIVQTLLDEQSAAASGGSFEVYYLNEWLDKIGNGRIPLTSETAQTKRKAATEEEQERIKKKVDALEKELGNFVIKENNDYSILRAAYNSYKPEGSPEEKMKIARLIREKALHLEHSLKEQVTKTLELETLYRRDPDAKADASDSLISTQFKERHRKIRDEIDVVITVIRSCAARGGMVRNTPVIIDKWFPNESRIMLNTKAFAQEKLMTFEALDPTIFQDKNGKRTAPRVLILPGVGVGMSWNDRIMLPLFSSPMLTPEVSLLKTLGGYRWFKTTMSRNWKDLPGELGSQYQLLYPDKTFTSLEKSFLEDYVTWMTREAQGFQVLSNEVRNLFWKKVPFAKDIKDQLAKRSTIYQKLWLKDRAAAG